jgi:hypothetical protein
LDGEAGGRAGTGAGWAVPAWIPPIERGKIMLRLVLVILVIFVLLSLFGGYSGYVPVHYGYGGGGFGLILLIIVLVLLFR